MKPQLVTLFIAHRVGQMVIAHFYSVTGQLQMLVGVVDVIQSVKSATWLTVDHSLLVKH